MNKFNIKSISKKFYDFVNEYDCGEHKKNKKQLENNKIAPIIYQWYMEDSMFFVFLYNKEQALKRIEEMLNTKNGTSNLIGKLENTFENDLDCYISQIEDLDYLTKDFVTMDQLSVIVNRKFEIEDDFKEKDYFNLYLKYKNLSDTLKSYYEVSF